MIGALLIAGLGAVAVGGVLACFRRRFAPGRRGSRRQGRPPSASPGSGCSRRATTLGDGFTSAFEPQFGVDGLSGLLPRRRSAWSQLPSLVFSLRYLRADAGAGARSPCLTAAFLLALAVVLCARDPLTFLVGWELMTLVPAAVILSRATATGTRGGRSSVYVAVTHLGGAGTWIAILLLAARRRDRQRLGDRRRLRAADGDRAGGARSASGRRRA